MIIKVLQPVITQAKLDSLEKALHKLQSQADSLHAITIKTEIGQNYFSQIIYLQLTLFVVIVTALIGISWRFLIRPVETDVANLRQEMNNLISEQKTDFNEYKNELEDRFSILVNEQNRIARGAMRGVYYAMNTKKSPLACFLWTLRLSKSYLLANDDELSRYWLLKAKSHLTDFSKKLFSDYFEEIIDLLNNLKKGLTKEDDKKVLEVVEAECYKQKYLPTQDTNVETSENGL